MRAWQTNQEDFDLSGRLGELKTQEEALRKEKENLVTAVAKGALSLDEIIGHKAKIEGELALIQQERDAALSRVAVPPDWKSLTLTREEFDLLDRTDQRRFLSAVLEEVTVYRDYALIRYRFPRAADGSRTSRVHLPPPRSGDRRRGNAD
jgi:hypothetical protein